MTRNEYRRALIMLRTLERGYSGHARLERRTTLGSLGFSVHAESGEGKLFAVLVGRRRNDYYAASLGELMRDCRGQASLNACFDPQNIGGKPLEAYQLAVVLKVEAGECQPVLAGNINGSYEMNWTAVKNAACALFVRTVEPRNGQEEWGDQASERKQTEVFAGTTETAGQLYAEPVNQDAEGDEKPVLRTDVKMRDNANSDFVGEVRKQTEVQKSEKQEDLGAEGAENNIVYGENTQTSVSNSAEMLGIRPETAWPASLENVRSLFEMSAPFEEIAIPGYVFVRAPLPANAGYPFCAVGIHAEDGEPKTVCYALPAAFSPETPAGLEGYIWHGDGNEGWWLIFLDAETGEEIENSL